MTKVIVLLYMVYVRSGVMCACLARASLLKWSKISWKVLFF